MAYYKILNILPACLALLLLSYTASAQSLPHSTPKIPASGDTTRKDTSQPRVESGNWTLIPVRETPCLSCTGRKWAVAGGHAALWGASFYTLNQAWYKGYPKSAFHFFNDNAEWLQMDKLGHLWTAYQMSRVSGIAWQWAGFTRRQAAWLGGISGVAYQSIIEIQDGFSAEWGFSWGDMTANIAGSALYTVQELLGGDHKLQVKLSYSPYTYSDDMKERRDAFFGKSIQERILKDYNSQTYWLSANLRSLMPASRLPKWLNVSVGYSGKGMLGGMDNTWTDKAGIEHDRSDIPRTRHFYLSADVDLTKIRTNNKVLRTVFYVLNSVKIPAPTLELSQGKLRGHWLYF